MSGLNDDVKAMLEKSPHPLPWTLAIFGLMIVAFIGHSVVIGIFAGITIGAYFGSYKGRFAVIAAWRRQLEADREQRERVENAPTN